MSNRALRLILALYPRRWRERYGDEFQQFICDLHADQPRPRLGLNLLINALTVHAACRPAWRTVATVGVSVAIAALFVGRPLLAPASNSDMTPRGIAHATSQVVIERDAAARDHVQAIRGLNPPITVDRRIVITRTPSPAGSSA
jgi:hypothetical protein